MSEASDMSEASEVAEVSEVSEMSKMSQLSEVSEVSAVSLLGSEMCPNCAPIHSEGQVRAGPDWWPGPAPGQGQARKSCFLRDLKKHEKAWEV